MRSKQEVFEFLAGRPLMALASVNEKGEPEAAIVAFTQTEKLELVFGTSGASRKARNILQHDRVAAVIGWDQEGTVQYEGNVRQLTDDEAPKFAALLAMKVPQSKEFQKDPEERYFLITPTWLRFTEFTTTPATITEFHFTERKI